MQMIQIVEQRFLNAFIRNITAIVIDKMVV